MAGDVVHLRAGGCSLLLDAADGGLPAIRHWGADLGCLDESAASAALQCTFPVARRPGEVQADVVRVVPEPRTGWMGRPGLCGSRNGRNWSPAFVVDAVRVDGRPVRGYVESGVAAVTVSARDADADLALDLEIELLPGGLVRQRATLTNHGADYDVDELSLTYPVPARAVELLDFAGRWGMERMPQQRAFGVGVHLRENRRGRTGLDAATVLHALEAGTDFRRGEAWGVHVAWSGNHRHYAEHDSSGVRLLGGGELLLPGEVRLGRGEQYRTPWLYGAYGTGLDGVAHRFHDYLRSRPRHPSPDRPVTLNVWEAVYFDHDADRLVELAALAAAVGVERFVLDDGWFGARRDARAGLGDWTVSRDVWPDGLHPLVDAVHERGMQFGLWFEPEMVNLDSDLARAHPEWIMAARRELPIEQRHQHVLNLSLPDCYAAVRDQILAVLAEYRIDYVKWDHNRDHVEAGVQPRGGAPGEHAQTLAVYRLLDEIRAAYPELEIESCSAGGGRIDLGILERTDRVWVSDCNDPLERQRLLRWTGQLLPPELMGAHIASSRSHTTGRRHDLSFRAATSLFGHLGVEWDIASATEQERAELAEWIALYRRHRRLICTGTVWRGPDPGDGLWAHGVVSADGGEALFEIVALAWSAAAVPPLVRLPGLDADRRYRVSALNSAAARFVAPRWYDESASPIPGAVLGSVGLQVPNLDPEHSLLIHLTSG